MIKIYSDKKFLTRKNVFPCVMFGSVLIFVLIETLYFKENVGLLSFIIAVPVFISSILKMLSNGLESINDKLTNFIERIKSWPEITYEMLDAVRLASRKEKNEIIENLTKDDNLREALEQYKKAFSIRQKIRKARRILLFLYYLLLMLTLVLLFLREDVYLVLSQIFSETNTEILAIWSFVVILFEIMMKDVIEDLFVSLTHKLIGINYDYY